MRYEDRRLFRATLLIGIGLMAAVDEIVFHQILGWHHFYDRATPMVGLVTDGILHAAELVAIVTGFFMYAEARRNGASSRRWAWAGGLCGAGGFQLFDGIVDHKLLRVHQIRYGVDELWRYDLAWNAAGVLLLVAGLLLARSARRASGR